MCTQFPAHIYAFIILAFQIKASAPHMLSRMHPPNYILSSLFVQVVYLLENSIFTLMRFNGIFTLNFIHLLYNIFSMKLHSACLVRFNEKSFVHKLYNFSNVREGSVKGEEARKKFIFSIFSSLLHSHLG